VTAELEAVTVSLLRKTCKGQRLNSRSTPSRPT
jgi:hypothetical protein